MVVASFVLSGIDQSELYSIGWDLNFVSFCSKERLLISMLSRSCILNFMSISVEIMSAFLLLLVSFLQQGITEVVRNLQGPSLLEKVSPALFCFFYSPSSSSSMTRELLAVKLQ
jgi:hypothetical protein